MINENKKNQTNHGSEKRGVKRLKGLKLIVRL